MFLEDRDTFQFEWDHLGNIELGRPNLGNTTSVAIYRLMQYTLRDSAIRHTDVETAVKIFYDAGYTSGKAIYENLIQSASDVNDLISKLQNLLKTLNIGILRMEKCDLQNMAFTLTVEEDLDCSGLPMHDEAICVFDEGLIAGVLDTFTGMAFEVKEVDCWCTGERICRFEAIKVE
ncbi:MAG: 4-vinyl reductase [Desulfobacteraceae bacterium]|nr:4-vinyl reductase [Desulfobacteraceae bacterium]